MSRYGSDVLAVEVARQDSSGGDVAGDGTGTGCETRRCGRGIGWMAGPQNPLPSDGIVETMVSLSEREACLGRRASVEATSRSVRADRVVRTRR